jgi:hypothetical protein
MTHSQTRFSLISAKLECVVLLLQFCGRAPKILVWLPCALCWPDTCLETVALLDRNSRMHRAACDFV